MERRAALASLGVLAVLLFLAANAGLGAAADTSPQIAHLIQQLNDSDLQRRRDAARDLGKAPQLSPEAIAALVSIEERTDEDGVVVNLANAALCHAGAAAIPALTKLAESSQQVNAANATGLLGCIAHKDKDAWPILIDLYKRRPATYAIGQLVDVGPPALPILIEALKSNDATLRRGAILTIAGIVSNSISLSDDDLPRQHHRQVQPDDLASAQPELEAALQSSDPDIRSAAAVLLSFADPNDRRAFSILLNQVNEGNPVYAGSAIDAFKAMGKAAKPAVPALQHILMSTSEFYMRLSAARALFRIDAEAACVPLEHAIANEQKELQDDLISTLLKIEPQCPGTIRTLIGTFPEGYPPGLQAVPALSKIGDAAVPALAAALKSSNLYVRQNAADALAGMKPLPPAAVQALETALDDPNSYVRNSATIALSQVGGEAQQAAEAAEKRDEKEAARKQPGDNRPRSKKEITATIPADSEHMYPLELQFIFPVAEPGQAPVLFVTVHAGKDRPDRLVIWKKIGADQYRQEQLIEDDQDLSLHYDYPFTFTKKYQRISNLQTVDKDGFFVDIPETGWRYAGDHIYVLDEDRLVPVQIDSPYGSPTGGNDFHDGKLEFSENLYNDDDPTCCPTGGTITGTYKIVEDTTKSPPTWKIVVATSRKLPPGAE